MRVAIYARVSTEDKGQDPENQLRDLRAWCAASGHELIAEYVDHVSGRKSASERKQFAALFDDASRRKFDCVLFWALDRFSREGMVPTIQHLERLNSYGVTFHSYTEPHLCADNEMVRGILLAVLATMAKQEAKRLSERVIAGMRKAAAKGTKSGNPIGRPRVDAKTEKDIQRLLQAGTGINKTAKQVGVGTATVQRIRAEMLPFAASVAAA
jgi:DNA invertase Pin-like site-specific DNA recombinase